LELANNRFEIVEQPICYNELSNIDEAFMTSTNKEIVPIVKIDDLHISNGKPGKNTQLIMHLFHDYTRMGTAEL
jgi:branched-chain amino acid aminotransferase